MPPKKSKPKTVKKAAPKKKIKKAAVRKVALKKKAKKAAPKKAASKRKAPPETPISRGISVIPCICIERKDGWFCMQKFPNGEMKECDGPFDTKEECESHTCM